MHCMQINTTTSYCIHKNILTHSRCPHAFREAHAERKQSESHGKFEEYTSFCYRKLYWKQINLYKYMYRYVFFV